MRRRVRGASETLAVEVADAVARMRGSDVQKPPGIAEAIDWLAALSLLGIERLDAAAVDLHARLGAQVRRGPGGDPRGRPGAARAQRWLTSAVRDDRPRPAAARRRAGPAPARGGRAGDPGALGRLRARAHAGAPEHAAGGCTGRPARCSSPTSPTSRPSTRSSARSSAAPRSPTSARARRRNGRAAERATAPGTRARQEGQAAAARRPACGRATSPASAEVEVPLALASDEERLAGKRFDALEPDELAQLYRLMSRLELATPLRRTRRYERGRHGQRIDMRADAARAACAPAATRSGSRAGAGAPSAAGS